MEALKPPRGLIIDLITPLKEDGAIDGRGLGQLLDRVLPCVQAVLVASPYMGEGEHLNPPKREELFDKTLVVTRGRVPVMAWISGETADETRATLLLLEKRLRARNYTGQVHWVDTPLYYHSNRGLFDHYEDLIALTRSPLLIHNDPDLIRKRGRPFKRNNIRTSILKQIVDIEGIQGLIFLGDLRRAYNYQRAARHRSHFRLYDGDENHFLRYPSLSGIVSAGANLAPRVWQKVTDSSLHSRETPQDYPDSLQQMLEAGEYLQKLRDLYYAGPVPLIKRLLSAMGIIGSPTSMAETGGMESRVDELKKLMAHHGDFDLNSSPP
jgi:dihydrodipicolinate synthase/N-acetylneuraminate lyase